MRHITYDAVTVTYFVKQLQNNTSRLAYISETTKPRKTKFHVEHQTNNSCARIIGVKDEFSRMRGHSTVTARSSCLFKSYLVVNFQHNNAYVFGRKRPNLVYDSSSDDEAPTTKKTPAVDKCMTSSYLFLVCVFHISL